MQQKDSWLLPDGIEEILPEEAKHLENLRSKLLDLFACWGYDLVIPPFIDFLDSLLTGSGHDLDLQTFKLTDQISGEMLGIRADMTPQVARMDAHNLKHEWPTRLCYVGTILHTRGDPLEKTRSPMQIGAELYGHAGKESDIEVIRLDAGNAGHNRIAKCSPGFGACWHLPRFIQAGRINRTTRK